MNGKTSKKLRSMAVVFHQSQPPNMPNKQTLEQIYNNLKKIHQNSNQNGLRLSSQKKN